MLDVLHEKNNNIDQTQNAADFQFQRILGLDISPNFIFTSRACHYFFHGFLLSSQL